MLFEDSGTGRVTQERRERERPPLGKLWNLASSRAVRARPGHSEAAAPTLLVIDRELEDDEAVAQAPPAARTPLHVVDDRMQVVDDRDAAFPSADSLAGHSSKGRERLLRLRAGFLLADVGAALTGAAFVELIFGLPGMQLSLIHI